MNTRWGGWISLFCFSLVSGFSQSEPSDHRIALDVVVTDKSGKPVSGLQQQDFTLLDNKQPAKIVSFQAVGGVTATADPPVEVVLLVDEVNTSFLNVANTRTAVEKFLGRNAGQLDRPVSLVFLSDSGTTAGNGSSRDGNALIADMKQRQSGMRTIGRSQGSYGAADRLNLSLKAMEQLADYESTKPGRKLVIWISPGWPLLSGPRTELTSKQREELFGTIVTVSDELRQARITLYSVDPLGTADSLGAQATEYKVFSGAVKNSKQVQIGNLALQVVAIQSGGRVLNSSNDVAGEIAASAADASAFYVLSFDGLAGDGPNEYHALDIKIDKPKLVARTRAGYYAQPAH
jgi:VWFA-related protein